MDIEAITPLRPIPALTERTNLFLKTLAHYKPNIEQTLESEIWEVARTHKGPMRNLPLVTQEVILIQLTDAIIKDTVAKYGEFYKKHRNEEEYVLKLSIGEAIEWYLDFDTMTMAILGESVSSVEDINKAIDELIKAETTVEA